VRCAGPHDFKPNRWAVASAIPGPPIASTSARDMGMEAVTPAVVMIAPSWT
jgi:hypothetical protein